MPATDSSKKEQLRITNSQIELSQGRVMVIFGLLGSPFGMLSILSVVFMNIVSRSIANSSDGFPSFIGLIGAMIITIIPSYFFGIIPSLFTGWVYFHLLKKRQIHLCYMASSTIGFALGGVCSLLLVWCWGLLLRSRFTSGDLGLIIVFSLIGACSGLLCGLTVTFLCRTNHIK